MSTTIEIKDLEKKRTQIIKELLNFRLIIPGSFKEVYRKCGKQNCWCHDKAGLYSDELPGQKMVIPRQRQYKRKILYG